MNGDKNLALFCDFENVALGVRDISIPSFDISLVLERLLLKGSIVTKKAYCDWDRYKKYKSAMHEAAFELIEIPHVKMSGKNSADIRMVVDALDLCYTKEHIDTFVIISGDSDFSPLVSKLRENAKTVIGVGVKQSTSDLLIRNCDEFIFYDDLVSREADAGAKVAASEAKAVTKRSKKKRAPKKADPAQEAIDLIIETTEALYAERGDRAKLWGSMIKQTLKRRSPGFNESTYGFSSFSDLLEEAEKRGQLELELDEKSGGYVVRALRSKS
ncbi:MAG TPA: NYN domain-containing protein [Woeseiaceae bacterium]|nr:NYN domain-containing protein [Woeseiaceae bacterium]